jgi:dTDP-glucose 4,6-dehydratase
MKILVTGGAGFMGSNFIRHIIKKYPTYQIVNLDKLTYAGNLDNLSDVAKNANYTFVKGDIADEKIVREVMQGVDLVVNYAAETHVDRSIVGPKDFALTDVIGTLTLLEEARKQGVKKFVQISTDEVFGSADDNKRFKEDSPFATNSPYSASKAGGDHLCRAYWKTYGFPTIVTHSCNFYGPYQYPEKIIPLFITNILQGKKVPLYGNGKNVREWIYTEDHCHAIDLIIHKGIAGEVYNISTEEGLENIELAGKILKLLGKDESSIEFVPDRLGHDFKYLVDSSKLRHELGWKPTVSFEEGLKNTIEWYKNKNAKI